MKRGKVSRRDERLERGGGRQVRGCSIFIGERRRNDFKCLQKLPRHRRFLIICIISIALIAAALIICRFMFSSGQQRWRRRCRWRRRRRRVISPASTRSDTTQKSLLNYLLPPKNRRDVSYVYWNFARRNGTSNGLNIIFITALQNILPREQNISNMDQIKEDKYRVMPSIKRAYIVYMFV